MPSARPKSIIVGHGATPIVCGDMLRRAGHEVYAVCSPDERLKAWAEKNGAAFFASPAELDRHVAEVAFDYLFSIVNYRILPAPLLSRPRRYAVNYHDGPLPRYAGTHVTSWALMNGERAHAVTWHVMVEEVDAGDILKQVAVAITSEDTAATLNRKCYVAAVRSFPELVRELDTGAETRTPQNLTQRSYYPFFHRPPNAGLIDFDRTSAEVSAFVRALSFGRTDNPIGTPKVLLEAGRWLAVGGVDVLPTPVTSPDDEQGAGRVLEMTGESIVVTTRDGRVALRGLTTLDGAAPALSSQTVPARVTVPAAELAARIDDAYARAARSEAAWVRRHADAAPATLPATLPDVDASRPAEEQASVAIPIAASSPAQGVEAGAGGRAAEAVLALHAAFLAVECGGADRDVGLSLPELRRDVAGLEELFACAVPTRLARFGELDRKSASPAAFAEAARLFTYARDVPLRYPEHGLTAAASSLPIVLAATERPGDTEVPPKCRGAQLTVVAAPDGACRWHFPASLAPTCEALRRRFAVWVESAR